MLVVPYFYATEKNKQEFNTTVTFIEICSKWCTLITARVSKYALGKIVGNKKTEEQFEKNITFLESIVELFRDIKIGYKPTFKPVQNGIMITTTSIIALTKYLITERKYSYVLSGRFTQDCLENIFSSIRTRHPIPNALQFKQNLKLLAISKYLNIPYTSSYNKDDEDIIGDFLKQEKRKTIESNTTIEDNVPDSNNNIHLDNIELNLLYNIAGYIITSINKCSKICSECLNSAGSKHYDANQKYSKFVHLRCFRQNTLFFVNNETFIYFYNMEIIIRLYLSHVKKILCAIL